MLLKYLFDRIVSLIGLLVLWPVLLVVAILIRIKMPGGPVLFVQKRVGLGGELFDCHKFRTMTVNHGGSTVSVAGDSRITPLGAKLRHWKLDELPGLWDVLIGKMSFVGPRPDVPGYADKLTGDSRDAQAIAEEYNDTVIYPDKVRLNCYYYRHYSFLKDLRMILCTVLGRKMEYAGEVI